VKVGDTSWRKGQKQAYKRIAGRKRLLVLDDETCQCPPPEPQRQTEPVVAKKPVRTKRPAPAVARSPIAALVGAAALIATAVAIAATAPLTVTAAAAVALIAVSPSAVDGIGRGPEPTSPSPPAS
jgi:hypothetical protein